MSVQIAIIGAGITGLTAGILLKEQLKDRDIRITVYEQRSSIESIGGGLSIWPNGAQVLMSLPCASEIKKLAGYFREERWGTASGETLRVVDRDLLLEINGAPFFNICRSELQRLLLQTLSTENVVFNHKVNNIEQNADNATIYFTNGDRIEADVVIGADGTYSTVRKQIFPDAKLEYAGYVALVGIYDSSTIVESYHNVIWGKNRLLLNFPIANDRHIVYTIRPLPKDELINTYSTRDQQFELFSGWSSEADNILATLKYGLSYPEYAKHYYCSENNDMSLLSVFNQENIVLVGDAAHPMGSIVGLNANLGLEDANTLVHHLSKNQNIQAGLNQFSLEHLSRVRSIFNLENEKRAFFLEATDSDYSNFTQFARSSTHNDFFSEFYSVLRAY